MIEVDGGRKRFGIDAGAWRRRPGRRARQGARPARPERRRQDHAGADPDDAAASPTAVSARVAGYDVVADAGRCASSIGLAGQYAAVDELLTGRENLELVGLWYHLEQARVPAPRPGGARALRAHRRRRPAGQDLLGRDAPAAGHRRQPDRPAAGPVPRRAHDRPRPADPQRRLGFIEELVAAGTTVLLTTQYMEEAERLAHQIVVIDTGRVIAQGTAQQLKEQMGGDMLEARVSDAATSSAPPRCWPTSVSGRPRIDPDQQPVSIPTPGGTGCCSQPGRRFEEEQIALDDLGIRRPSLDDVFLALTGAPAGTDRRRRGGYPSAER